MHTLFLDRDGVINRKLEGDYVKEWDEFVFIEGVIDALKYLRPFFKYIIVVTNQRGISRGFMTSRDLEEIHSKMISELLLNGVKIDAVYYCPDEEGSPNRKPQTGMALMAQSDFPQIIFDKSIMVGDSLSDLQFGAALGMKCVWVSTKIVEPGISLSNIYGKSLIDVSNRIIRLIKH
jgi:histidinol-phosphate phosphatase family protein